MPSPFIPGKGYKFWGSSLGSGDIMERKKSFMTKRNGLTVRLSSPQQGVSINQGHQVEKKL